jgi:site-specific DNA-methyltransferase (adenine-specific)
MRQSQALARQSFPEGGERSPLALCGSQILPSQAYRSEWGILFNGDCLHVLPHIRDSSIDTVFADPPFNLAKNYGRMVNDDLPVREYVEWCKSWLVHCERVLKPGGALFVNNLLKWNI